MLRWLTLIVFLIGTTGCMNGGAQTTHPDADGLASYYADHLAGNTTASGEPYDPNARTAAHRTLPFGTRVRITRVDTGDKVIVRINDRGPQKRERIVDLSRRAAEALNMIEAGVVSVTLEVLDEGTASRKPGPALSLSPTTPSLSLTTSD